MSEEKVLTLRGKKAVWAPGGGSGPIDPKRLPEGYPYKESNMTVIEWDGDITGKVNLGGTWYKVSDIVPTKDEVIGGNFVFAGEEIPITSTMDMPNAEGTWVCSELGPMVVTEENPYGDEPGTYFYFTGEAYCSSFSYGSETIHPMAPEFLPELTSPNGTKYQLTVSDDGTLSAVAVE